MAIVEHVHYTAIIRFDDNPMWTLLALNSLLQADEVHRFLGHERGAVVDLRDQIKQHMIEANMPLDR